MLSCFNCVRHCNPVDCSLMGFSVHGILQANLLEWVAMPSSTGSSQPRDGTWVSYTSCIGNQILYHFSTIQTLDSHWLPSLFFSLICIFVYIYIFFARVLPRKLTGYSKHRLPKMTLHTDITRWSILKSY